ncbi:hypothetical protein PGR6_54780 [Pseudomonas sp. GR 6-02]|nr:hypothetical protein PGR6_54780 [Pseudomonas sp. GR 6-02]
MPKRGTKGRHYRPRDVEGHCQCVEWRRGGLSVARELAPARLRSSRKTCQYNVFEETGCLFWGALRTPAGASSLATMSLLRLRVAKTTCLVWSPARKPG